MKKNWRAGILGRILALHSVPAHDYGGCWCQRSARRKAARDAASRGWLDSPCDGCEGALEAPSYVLMVKPGRFMVCCPSCTQEFRAAGASIARVLA